MRRCPGPTSHGSRSTRPTGPAIGLYESAGYRPIPCWGAYAELDGTLCFERALTPS